MRTATSEACLENGRRLENIPMNVREYGMNGMRYEELVVADTQQPLRQAKPATLPQEGNGLVQNLNMLCKTTMLNEM